MKVEELTQRIDNLETKVAYQEHTLEELNQTLISHELEIAKMREHLRLLVSKLQTVAPSMVASQSEETPPPHY
ncbi:SlyX family protein [Tatumella sp. TA1]|uniref:SlyX family protein n=2 Tax=Rosenbergiella TaxID=1356488 RepID=UPI0008F8BA54|nr:SlyX family protein [Rosenbergiella collisarenosi]MBT0722155.1 SlyX family protein [Rosenbergiella collisarenosi]QGX90236.1 SlyX family protein [Tatumella sp. TA1]